MYTIILRWWIKQKKTGHPLGVHFMYFLHITDTFLQAGSFWTQEGNREQHTGSIYFFISQPFHTAPTSFPQPQRQIKCSHFVNITAPRDNGAGCSLSISIRSALQDSLPTIMQASPIPNLKARKFYGKNVCLTFSSNVSFHIAMLEAVIKFKNYQNINHLWAKFPVKFHIILRFLVTTQNFE